ncbi:ATP synthase F1 subunit delta [soil metagenome]
MRGTAISRNYAETLLALADRHGGEPTVDDFGRSLAELNRLLDREPRIRKFLETPLIEIEAKTAVVRQALEGRVPDLFLRFVLVVIQKRRAPFLEDIAEQYGELVDQRRGRVRAEVVVAREPDEQLREEIRTSLQRMLGLEVLPSFRVDRGLIGGVVVRVGDQILDGSVRKRASELRRHLLVAKMPSGNGARATQHS